MTKADARSLALSSLLLIEEEGRASHIVIRRTLAEHPDLPAQEKAFYRRLVEGTIEWRLYLDALIDHVSKIKTEKMKPLIREDLRLAVYQLTKLSAVPASAAVNEAVKLARKRGFGQLSGFVNGVLRKLANTWQEIPLPGREKEPVRYLSVNYSVPEPIVRMWTDRYGFETCEKMLASFQEPPELVVRVRAGGDKALSASGADYARAAYPEDARILRGVTDLAGFPPFANGHLVAQDVSSQIAVRAAGIRAGDRVLDLCAAPGGKSLYAADLCAGRAEAKQSGEAAANEKKRAGQVTANDLTKEKTAMILENIARCGIDNIDVTTIDAAEYVPAWDAQFDVVLADLPCSGLGVIGRKPDIRYHASDEKSASLIALQRQILANAVRYVKKGGTLLYSTCTIDARENEEQAAWIQENSDLTADHLEPYLPEALISAAKGNQLQLLPGVHPCDGFFVARFRRGS